MYHPRPYISRDQTSMMMMKGGQACTGIDMACQVLGCRVIGNMIGHQTHRLVRDVVALFGP